MLEVDVGDVVDGDLAGQFADRVGAHAVGDQEQVAALVPVLDAGLRHAGFLDLHVTDRGPATAAAPTMITGCLEGGSGKFLLTDETSLVRFEVMGAGVEKEVGHRVQIAGTVAPVPESISQVHSTSVKMLSKKCSSRGKAAAAAGVGAAGAGAAGAGAAGAGTIGAIGTAIATHAVIAGVIVAGAATAATVAVVKTQDSGPASISPSAP